MDNQSFLRPKSHADRFTIHDTEMLIHYIFIVQKNNTVVTALLLSYIKLVTKRGVSLV